MQGIPWKLARSPLSPPVMSPVGSGIGTQSGGGGGGGSGLAIPTELRSLLFHDDGTATKYPAYYTEQEWAGHGHLLKDYSLGVGDLREKRLGYCYELDGVNDEAVIGNLGASLYAINMRFYTPVAINSASANRGLFAYNFAGNAVNALVLGGWTGIVTGEVITLGNSISDRRTAVTGITIPIGWHEIELMWNAGENRYDILLDGVIQAVTSGSSTHVPQVTLSDVRLGRGHTSFGNFKISDVIIKSDANSVVAHYPLQEESGITAYDISGNGNHGTILNAVTSGVGSIHQPDAGVVMSYPNDEGYTLSGNVIIPAVSSTQDAIGGDLTYTGHGPNYGLAKGPAWQGDGSTVYVDLGAPVIPASSDFTITIPYEHADGVGRAIFSQTETTVTVGKLILYANAVSNGLRLTHVDGKSLLLDLFDCLTVGETHQITITRSGTLVTLTCAGPLGTFTNSATPASLVIAQFNTHLLSYAGSVRSAGAVGRFAITTGGITTTYSPIEGTRNVAVTKSDGTYSVITDAVKNGALATLYIDGDGSWRLPAIENGANFDGTGLYPAAPGASVAVNGSALDITANKHPIGVLVDRTGGVAAPFDNVSGASNYTDEEFNDIPTESTLNKRGLSIYAADRYGAALEDIQS